MISSRLIPCLIFCGILATSKATENLQVGDEICIEGYVMDRFCIDLGTLLDNPSVRTLEQPELHSYHCLLDVSVCYESGYEILLDPKDNGAMYTPGVQLDEAGDALVLEVGRAHGSCSTCDSSMANNEKGFRAVAMGMIIDAGSATERPTLAVTSLEEASVSSGCPGNETLYVFMNDNSTMSVEKGVNESSASPSSQPSDPPAATVDSMSLSKDMETSSTSGEGSAESSSAKLNVAAFAPHCSLFLVLSLLVGLL